MSAIVPEPLPCRTLDEAARAQFRLVDLVARHLGGAMLAGGDLGLPPDTGRPHATAAAEQVLAEFFGTEDCALVRGAGTGALRSACMALLSPGARLVVHDAPTYPTTAVTARAMGLDLVKADFHDTAALAAACSRGADAVLIQHARQRLGDRYRMADVIAAVRASGSTAPILTDESYTAMRVPQIGAELGADYSAFSLFKLQGPEGLGCVVGKTRGISAIRRDLYSGGSQVQGHEALAALRALITAPVAMAVQAAVVDQVVGRLNSGEVPGVGQAFVANAQARVAIAFLGEPIAPAVMAAAARLGAAPYPVGAESQYEVIPLFYRLSHTFLSDRPDLAERAIRINPMRAGADTVLRILAEAIRSVPPKLG